MKVSYLLLISLLIVGVLFVPAVSAEEIYNETFTISSDGSIIVNPKSTDSPTSDFIANAIVFSNSMRDLDIKQLIVQGPATHFKDLPSIPAWWPVSFTDRYDNTVGSGTYSYFFYKVGGTDYVQITVEIDDLDLSNPNIHGVKLSSAPSGYSYLKLRHYGPSGKYTVPDYLGTFLNTDTSGYYFILTTAELTSSKQTADLRINSAIKYTTIYSQTWQNQIVVDDEGGGTVFHIIRDFPVNTYSTVRITTSNGINVNSVNTNANKDFRLMKDFYPLNVIIDPLIAPTFERIISLGTEPETPTPTPTEPSVLRTGTVTMTDHNGTSISGFEVTAVNHYTGESYNVSTDTDVAVMTLPMDRTTEIRNPQTGVYEEAPVGYYLFYGQASGYKMLNEDGIQVAVMPEKYGSYKLCDIGVMSDSGPLTGKHKFQIRSRSDNSILQSGTISAKSATTGEWFNTTVCGGIATLVLPYDTSNPISQYAGNYYVYGTSPGYEDSDYGTQIVVMPHTVSEIYSIQLTPIGGVPIPGNVTLRIQAISETGSGVVNAEIFIAGVLGAGSDIWDTYTASSTGYLSVSVPGNSTYDIVARGDGYYDTSRRIQVFTDDPDLIEIKLYLSGYPTLTPEPTEPGWPTDPPPTQPPGGIPDDDDDSDGFLVQAVRGIGLAFGVGFSTAKIIFGMLLALAIGFTTAKQLRGGAAEFGMGLLGGTMLGVLIGLLPVWIIVVLLLVVGLYIGNRYVGGANNG